MNFYDEIKNNLVNNEVYKRAKDYSKNKNDINTYYNVGKLLSEAGKCYGEGIIKEYSKKLTLELGKGYTVTRLKYMRQFYTTFKKSPTVSGDLSWSHYLELLVLKEPAQIDYYTNLTINYNLSVRELRARIKNKEYERLEDNVKEKLKLSEETNVGDLIKNTILIKSNICNNDISERMLKQLILEDLGNFLKELGNGFTYIGNEYKIKIGNRYNYIDMLLFNYIFNCFVVIEFKVTELKKEHIGQIKTYMHYIDSNTRTIYQSNTIGIVICKKDNKFIMEYVSDSRIFSREYDLININY